MGSGCSPAGFRQFFPGNSQHFCVAPAWASAVSMKICMHLVQSSIVTVPLLHCTCAVSRFHCPAARFAFQRFPAATAGFPLQIFHCDGPSLHFRGSLPPLRGFHFKSSIVTVPLLHCTLCSVKVPLSSRQV